MCIYIYIYTYIPSVILGAGPLVGLRRGAQLDERPEVLLTVIRR